MPTATPVGTNTILSISRRFVLPQIIDQIYRSNALFYRMDRSNKRKVQGGTQIEVPLMYARIGAAGSYSGFDPLDTTPTDIMKNAAWAWKQYYCNVTFDGLTLLKNDSPESIANIVETYFEAARMEMEEQLGTDLYSDAVTNTEAIDGLRGAIDNGTVAATYGGLGSRTTTNSFWQPRSGALDTTTATLTLDALQAVFGAATDGARHPTLIVTTQANYNRLWSATQIVQTFPSQAMGSDEQLAKAGFTNILFNNVPVVVDPHCPANTIFFLNEEYIELIVHSARDFDLQDFRYPTNQDAGVAPLFWAGNLIVKNIANQGKMTAVAA